MRVIAVPREGNDLLVNERSRLCTWAPANGWLYIDYRDAVDLLSQLGDAATSTPQPWTDIEIVAHGNPGVCDDVTLGNAAIFGGSLKRITGESTASLYLSGCNTGLEFNGECVARSLAEGFQGPVFGARGYMGGTHAEGTEHCSASFEYDGIVYHAYPGGIDAVGDQVWNRFGPPAQPSYGDAMQIKIATSGFRPISLAGEQARELLASVEQAIRRPPARPARLRVAPDLTFAIRLADGERLFELLAGGTVLRDPVTKHVWQLEGGSDILRSLWPYRTLPAA